MKRIYLFIIPLLCFLIQNKVYAISGADLMAQFNEATNNNFDNVSLFNDICTKWETMPDCNLLIYETGTQGNYHAALAPVITIDTQINFQAVWYRSSQFNNNSNNRPTNTWQKIDFNGSAAIYGDYLFLEQFEEPIDFDTVYYSANIPVPNIKVTYANIPDTSIANVPLYVEFSDKDNLSGLYIDYRVQFLPVNYVSVNVQRGNVTYSRLDPDTNYVTYDVIANSDLQLIDDLYYQSSSDNYMTRYKDVMSAKWGEFLKDYSPESNLSFTFPTNLNNGMQQMYSTKYKNVRTTQCMFGNYMRIWVRYFILDEENHYKVGAWRVWECYDSSASEWGVTMPEYYIYGDTAVGSTNVYSDENADTNQDIPQNSGTPTGENNPNIQVTVNQNVPNYPDYPTAVSYNHDNVLMQFIQTANYIPSMFSGYTSFLTAAFGFIPSGIWTIIGMGFLSCIVVMIVKVL